MKWEPIETSPGQGIYFLGWHKIHKCPIAIRYSEADSAYIEKTLTTMWPTEAFSHWAPMPDSPFSRGNK